MGWGTISRKVAGSILDGVIGIFYWLNTSSHTLSLGSTQPLTEMSTRYISCGGGGVKAAGAESWQPYQLHMPIVLKSGSLNLLETSGPVQDCTGIELRLLSRKYFNIFLVSCRGQSIVSILRFPLWRQHDVQTGSLAERFSALVSTGIGYALRQGFEFCSTILGVISTNVHGCCCFLPGKYWDGNLTVFTSPSPCCYVMLCKVHTYVGRYVKKASPSQLFNQSIHIISSSERTMPGVDLFIIVYVWTACNC
jgi:hypothetical protein